MSYKSLHVFYEGPDDERFINRVIKPLLMDSYNLVVPVSYQSNRNKGKLFVVRYIKSIEAMPFDDYIFLADIDDAPCITKSKEDKKLIYDNRLDDDKIVIVVKEIEGWYYAGAEKCKCDELGIQELASTDVMTKEDFNIRIPKRFERQHVMVELLNQYSIECAKSKNRSFKYFMDKHILS